MSPVLGLPVTYHLFEDDEALAAEIVHAFADAGMRIMILPDAEAVVTAARSSLTKVLILDRMVGGRDSLAIVGRVRADGLRVPVLVISSLASVDDRIFGLKTGGDDYLVKPFAMGELVARVAALDRRGRDRRETRLEAGPLVMDLLTREVRRGTREITLAPREFGLLEYLMRHAGLVVTRAMLLEDVWQYRAPMQTNVVDVHIGNLRRKIDIEGEHRLIASVRGLGFRLNHEPPSESE